MPNERFHVRVAKESFIFSCGHFITLDGDQCERLHGHNYRVGVEVEGPLDENHYVFDFLALRDRTLAITTELDHHMLIAMRNPLIPVVVTAKSVRVNFGDKEWIFPRGDCVLLDIENTTAELLAKWIAHRLIEDLRSRHFPPQILRLEVEENIGQSAVFHWTATDAF